MMIAHVLVIANVRFRIRHCPSSLPNLQDIIDEDSRVNDNIELGAIVDFQFHNLSSN